ncbi:MAG: transcriptional regulator NrdR [Clostridia bacterium]|nr:transcriptional regulator NrdR [Clostridia bacterium]
MRCPNCGCLESRVVDSRQNIEGNNIRRRRECMACQKRFTTFEVVEAVQIIVIKKDGSKELFDRSKLLKGLLKACEKRPVNAEAIAIEIESELQNSLRQEVTSGDIGEMVMRKLKAADDVAYVRFASVYREFKDIETFIKELNEMKSKESVFSNGSDSDGN